MQKRSLAYKVENAFCDAERHFGDGKPRHEKSQEGTIVRYFLWLVLEETALAFGAFDCTSENPKRKGKQHREKTKQCNERLADFCEPVAFDQDLTNAVESVGCRK